MEVFRLAERSCEAWENLCIFDIFSSATLEFVRIMLVFGPPKNPGNFAKGSDLSILFLYLDLPSLPVLSLVVFV